MSPRRLDALLRAVRSGRLSVEHAAAELRQLPFEDVGLAHVDHHRAIRCGHPEVILGSGKTADQVLRIAERIAAAGSNLLVTRVEPPLARALRRRFPGGRWSEPGRVFGFLQETPPPGRGVVLVISAGTSDIPVAEEAAFTLEFMGNEVERIYDVGVAGIHRVLAHGPRLREAQVLVVVAGMEGALASVVGGLTDRPVIAVPTSVGYGASFSGIAALLAMLNSCASGVSVVNIDNGFGAACSASLMNHEPVGVAAAPASDARPERAAARPATPRSSTGRSTTRGSSTRRSTARRSTTPGSSTRRTRAR